MSANLMSADLIIGIVFPLVGGLLFVIGAFLFIRTRIFLGKAQETKGTVTQMVYRRSSKGGGGYSPVYEFRTIDGQTITGRDNLSTNPPMFQVGQTIDVLYDPANPNNARIKKWMSLYFTSVLLCGMGATFGCTGLALLAGRIMSSLN
ncbi:MAG: DUF3592 domain-containing protein [Anaerolineales bacterium]|nr:DUF3592 domain-containing protein [Anaerolineales bacterium]